MTSIKSLFVSFCLVVTFSGCVHVDHSESTWQSNRESNTKVTVVCESNSPVFTSCYAFNGYYADIDENGIVTLIDEDHNRFKFINMSCIVAPQEQIGDSVCQTESFFDEEEDNPYSHQQYHTDDGGI